MVDFRIVIPARYESTRFPGKLLKLLAGKPIIQRVYEQALKSHPKSILIATDHQTIVDAAKKFGAEVCLTSSKHRNGSMRVAEAVSIMAYDPSDIIVNLQADEPLIPFKILQQVADNLEKYQTDVATLCVPIDDPKELFNTNVTKVVMNKNAHALYFSRSVIPWDRNHFKANTPACSRLTQHYRHIGLYAHRVDFLKTYTRWPTSPIESAECLEQLSVLWQGGQIHVEQAQEFPPPGIDTPEDLKAMAELFGSTGLQHYH